MSSININELLKEYGAKTVTGIMFISYIIILFISGIGIFEITRDWIHCIFIVFTIGFLWFLFEDHNIDRKEKTNFLDKITEGLNSSSYAENNGAIEEIRNNKEKINKISKKYKLNLGKSILRAADNGSYEARVFIDNWENNINEYSYHILKGILLFSFIDKDNKLHLRNPSKRINKIMFIVDKHPKRKKLMRFVQHRIKKSKGIYLCLVDDSYSTYMQRLEQFDFTKKLIKIIKDKKEQSNG